MDKNLIKEKWAEICFVLSKNIQSDINERDFDYQVLRAIEILGWSEFKGEIKRKPTIQIGRQGSLIPDIVIKGVDDLTLVVIEVKRPIEDLTKDESIGQLKSYMRQLKAEFGLLIGRELRIYYDGSQNPQSDPLLLEKIVFENDSNLGWEFVENFNKIDFIEKKYVQYLRRKIGKFNEKLEIKKLTEILLSESTKEKIINFLQAEYADFGKEIFTSVMKCLSVDIFINNDRPKKIEDPYPYRAPNDIKPVKNNQSFIINLTAKTPMEYNLIPMPKKIRHYFPGYRIPFYFETDIGLIESKVTAARKDTVIGDPLAGAYIKSTQRNKLTQWFRKHNYLKIGDNFLIEVLEPKKKFRLSILK